MSLARERAALLALLRLGHQPWPVYAEMVEAAGAAWPALRRELSGGPEEHVGPRPQLSLLTPDRSLADPLALVSQAEADIAAWQRSGWQMLTVLDPAYPSNLRRVHDRPPVIFVAGHLTEADVRSVAIIGSRRASRAGLANAARIADHLVSAGFVVVSGLAAGIDAAAHQAALAGNGRTVAVIGTGLAHSYPEQNAALQRRIAATGAVISQFWPDTPPSRMTFPMRNAVMSGLTLGSVIVEASVRSGARVQARRALAHGRPVFLLRALLAQPWARQLAARPGVYVVDGAPEIVETVQGLNAGQGLTD
jgi:DNA processing protein